MTGEKFIQRLQIWKQEFKDDVIPYFQTGNEERGDLAFERWKERFEAFLRRHFPKEAARFKEKTTHHGYIVRSHESSYEKSMREDGNTCIAFIDDLAESVLRGRVRASPGNPSKPRRVLASSPKVFLSSAREDIVAARRLYKDLRRGGADVWFDEESLQPGQKWKPTITKAIRDSRFFLALLSTKAVSKRGYVQKEMREALDVLAEYPESEIYLLPVRLDDCTPSDTRLNDINWVDMFPDWSAGVARILKVLTSTKRTS